jgi:hypothetical protein
MSPLPDRNTGYGNINDISLESDTNSTHFHTKRINLNPLHYITSPLKNRWDTVAPVLAKYRDYTRIISIFLAGLSMLVMLDNHKWKLPRWPWAKDGKLKPRPSYQHQNERLTVDELAEKKLMEMLKEMKIHEGAEDVPWDEEPLASEGVEVEAQEVENQVEEDNEIALGDVIDEVEMEGAVI